ncbi:UDP-2,3-diacylglucosamine diphosphatase, partial [Pandoraea apista]
MAQCTHVQRDVRAAMTTIPTFELPISTPAARAGHFADTPPGRPAA